MRGECVLLCGCGVIDGAVLDVGPLGARHLAAARTQFIEPPWKALLSSKGLLPFLWEMAPNHPNLLPCFFSEDPKAKSLADHVVKPLYSREGANIRVHKAGAADESSDGRARPMTSRATASRGATDLRSP